MTNTKDIFSFRYLVFDRGGKNIQKVSSTSGAGKTGQLCV